MTATEAPHIPWTDSVPSPSSPAGVERDVSRRQSVWERRWHRGWHSSLAAASLTVMRGLHWAFNEEPPRRPSPAEARLMTERIWALLEQDLENAEAGWYPKSLVRSFPWGDFFRRAPLLAADIPRLARRRREGNYQDIPAWVDRSRYPHYYLRNFHWQTDGWFSDRSARLYELSVELLFGGTADVMRRMAIPPVVQELRRHSAPRLLDVACGTGRFLRSLHAAAPRAKLTGLDLSPAYIKEAERVLRRVPDVSLLVDNAEEMPLGDSTFDVVTSVFLFHELPRRARRRVVREMARVVKPGGLIVICDSAQFAESEALRPMLEGFPHTYHEPYYREYLKDDLAGVLSECGLDVLSSEPFGVSKVVVARATRRS